MNASSIRDQHLPSIAAMLVFHTLLAQFSHGGQHASVTNAQSPFEDSERH